MSMSLFQQGLRYENGRPAKNVSVQVNDSDGNLADLFLDWEGTSPLSNPLTTDEYGNLFFYAEDGVYYLEVGGASVRVELAEDLDIEEVMIALEPPVDLTVLFENSLA